MSGRVLIIAEAGVNHNGDIGLARALIDAAVDAGADVVKFQTFVPEEVISRFARKAEYQERTTGASESQLDMVRKLALPMTAYGDLADYCRTRDITFLSTPFDLPSLEVLVRDLRLDTIKLASGEVTNAPLLLASAAAGVEVILSTGMSTLDEVREALGVLAAGYLGRTRPTRAAFAEAFADPAGQAALRAKVRLLHCTTEYPAPFTDANLRAMDTLRDAFGLPVGFSDHTPGINIPIAAVARGAVIVEKHFTLDRAMPGPDHKASLNPAELKAMVEGIRQVEAALGDGRKVPAPSEVKNIAIARRSIVARRAVAAGAAFGDGDLTAKRPGDGISPLRFWEILGTSARRAYEPDEQID